MQGVDGIRLPSSTLKSYTELNRHVIATGLSSLYRLWLLCRSLDSQGRGVIGMGQLRSAMQEAGLGRRTLQRVRSSPQCHIFFTFHQHKVEYRSLESVCLALAVEPGRAVRIPVSCLNGLESFHAHLYAAWIGGQESLLISRERLSGLFGISQDTQRRWERLTGVEVTYNVIEVEKADEQLAERHIPQDARLDRDRLGRNYRWEYQGRIYYRTVNRYRISHLHPGAVGNVRKVAKTVRNALPVEHTGDGTGLHRIFFDRRTMPANYQETPGDSVRSALRSINTDRGVSHLWRFSRWRPVSKKAAMS